MRIVKHRPNVSKVLAWTMIILSIFLHAENSNKSEGENKAIYTNATLQKEFPKSVQIRHGSGSTFIDKSKITDSDLKLLRDGQTVSINLLGSSQRAVSEVENGSASPPKGLTLESLEHYLREHLDDPPRKNPGKGFNMPDPLPMVASAYRGWNYLDVIVFNNWHRKEHNKRSNPTLGYKTSGELFLETIGREYPKEHSNKQAWIEAGLKTRQQDGENCGLFAVTSLVDVLLIKEGHKSPNTNPTKIWEIFQKTSPIKGGRYSAQFAPGLITSLSSYGISKFLNSPALKSVRVNNCSNFFFDPSEFPYFIMKGLDPTLDPELANGLRDRLMKHEISQGRPVILEFQVPKSKIFDKIHPKNGNQDIIIRPRTYAGAKDPHSVLIVGYKEDPQDPKSTIYEFLNSWGTNWGKNGYGWVSSKYLDLFARAGSTVSAYSVEIQ